jgi:hypothetical protein
MTAACSTEYYVMIYDLLGPSLEEGGRFWLNFPTPIDHP